MPETKNDFMLLAVHTDKEFTRWLNQHAEAGWWLKENKGNTFVFIKRSYSGKRICSYTVRSDMLGVSAEDVFYERQDDLRKRGWKLLVMGKPENFTDRTRHAFLTEAPAEDRPSPEIPLSEPEGQLSLLRAALKKAASTLGLCLLYAAVIFCFMVFRPDLLFTGALGTIFLVLTAIVYFPCVYFSLRAVMLYTKNIREPETEAASGEFLCLDRAVMLSSVMLFILAAYMILDFLV